MFEGKLPQTEAAGLFDDEHAASDPLRLLSWNDLVARLSAARELRAALRPPGVGSEGSFDAGSARRIAAHAQGKQALNLDDSAFVKSIGRTVSGVGPHGEPGVPAVPRGSK